MSDIFNVNHKDTRMRSRASIVHFEKNSAIYSTVLLLLNSNK